MPFFYPFGPDLHLVEEASGLSHLSEHDSPSTFWDHVRGQLQVLPGDRDAAPQITKVLLAGENATHPGFMQTLRDALGKLDLVLVSDFWWGCRQGRNRCGCGDQDS